CELRAGHFLVSSGITYLAVASGGSRSIDGTTDPEKIETALANGVRVVTQAIRENGQDDNGAAWYYLGRLYLQGGDVQGADSAFTKAQGLAPACGEDIKSWRQKAWIPLATPAAEYANQGKTDSAVILFKQAARMVPNMPQAPYNLGVLYANAGETDSALTYFKLARDLAAADAQYNQDRNSATFNLAAMYQRAGRHAEAVTELKQYLEWSPNDSDARRALASSLRASGQNEEAAAVEEQIIAAASASGTLTSSDLMAMGVNQFNDKHYDQAAESFEKLRATEPNNRDALY
ncbi:MAG TPA: tetratricopeptide repeat protein, partial [Gemmatimonadales bacterium]|nr:tetratricopeptide repeat protein [Gemmatimonadales bacterium]